MMTLVKPALSILILMLGLSGCATWNSLWGDEQSSAPNPDEAPAEEQTLTPPAAQGPKPIHRKEMELKLARLWAKVEELEQKTDEQKQRLKILEKGLMLGVIPDELLDPAERRKKATDKPQEPADTHIPPVAVEPKQTEIKTSTIRAPEVSYEERVAQAQQFFERGQYGRSIAEYSAIEKDFPDRDTTGGPAYWIAVSWAKLKEYDSAHKHLSEFVERFASSPWIARAHFQLAKVESELGLKERSVQRLRMILEKFPNEDAAQMAKLEMNQMEKAL